MLQAFAETYSLSLQQTLYQMGARIIDHRERDRRDPLLAARTSTTSWSTWSRSA